MRVDHTPDLLQLHSIAVILDLLVAPAQVLDLSAREPTRAVSRAVETLSLSEPAEDEAFCGQFLSVEVARADACAADVDFTDHTRGHRFHPRIEQIDLSISSGDSDRDTDSEVARLIEAMEETADGGFCGPVFVVDFDFRAEPLLDFESE
jgi:hypothetical protein